MAKKITKIIKLQATGGQATPGTQLGPTLGQAGVNIGEFVTKFNEATKDRMGETVPVVLTVYEDRSFSFVLKTPPAAYLILRAAGIEKGSGRPNTEKKGKITKAQAREIAEKKLADLSAHDVDAAVKIIEGSARSMGIEVK